MAWRQTESSLPERLWLWFQIFWYEEEPATTFGDAVRSVGADCRRGAAKATGRSTAQPAGPAWRSRRNRIALSARAHFSGGNISCTQI